MHETPAPPAPAPWVLLLVLGALLLGVHTALPLATPDPVTAQ